jgi:DHA2 family multidrug resistance protein-like MFS transporter
MYHPLWLHEVEEEDEKLFELRWVALVFLCLAILISAIDTTIANVALPAIGEDLGATTSQLQWVMDSFNIILAGFVLLGGGLADRYGRKGVFMIGFALFGAASLVAAFSTTIEMLIISRAFMGLGAAFIYPPALSLLAVLFPPDERSKAIAFWSAIGGLGIAFGPVLGGILLDEFWWGSIFLVNVPVTIVGLIGVALVVPTSRRPNTPPLDRIGALLSVVGLGALVFGIIEGPGRGWTSPLILASILVGITASVAFFRWEMHHKDPMFDPRVFRIGGVMVGGAVLFIGYVTLTGVLFVTPLYLQFVLDDSTLKTGLSLLPLGLTFTFTSFFASRIAKAFGLRTAITGGLLAVATGIMVISLANDTGGYTVVAIGSAIFGFGLAVTAPTATTTVINALPSSKAGDASAVNQLSRQVGAAFGVAVIGSVFATTYSNKINSATSSLTTSEATEATDSISGAITVADELDATASTALQAAADAAFDSGLQMAMIVAAALTLTAAGLAFFVLRRTTMNTPA